MKKRIWEGCKTVLIVLLTLLVLILTLMAMPSRNLAERPFLSKLLRPFAGMLGVAEAELTYTAPPAQRMVTAAAQPIAITLHTDNGRTTLARNFQTLDSAYEQLGSLLAKALDSASDGKTVPTEKAMDALRQTSVAFCFPCRIPADVLSVWMNVQSFGRDAAQWYILKTQDEEVRLLLLGQSCIELHTELSAQTVLEAIAGYSPDDSFFAFEDVAGRFDAVDPLSLILPTESLPAGVWSNPCEARWISNLASGLGFNPYSGARYVDHEGTTSFTDRSYALHITGSGDLTLEILQADSDFQSNSESDADRIEAARRVVQQLAGDVSGQARLLFSGMEDAVCSFTYYLSGLPVSDGTHEAARVIFEGNQIRKITMHIRTYHLTDQLPTLLPPAQAASIATPGQQLHLIYAEQADRQLCLNWEKE